MEKCFFCNRVNTSKENRWEGSVDLLINGVDRGNNICDLGRCQDKFMDVSYGADPMDYVK